MNRSIFALVVAVMFGGIGSATTQTLAADVVPPYEVFTIVRSMGLSPLGQPSLRGRVYVLRAGNSYGEQVRVVVDARAGQVVSVEPLAARPDPYFEPGRRPPAGIPGPRTGTYEQGPRVIPADPRYVPRGEPRPAPPPRFEPDELDEEDDVGAVPPPRNPPRAITMPRFPDVPSARSAGVMPAKPPLPRSRPAATVASGESARGVTGSIPTPPAKPAAPKAEQKPDAATPPMQGFE